MKKLSFILAVVFMFAAFAATVGAADIQYQKVDLSSEEVMKAGNGDIWKFDGLSKFHFSDTEKALSVDYEEKGNTANYSKYMILFAFNDVDKITLDYQWMIFRFKTVNADKTDVIQVINNAGAPTLRTDAAKAGDSDGQWVYSNPVDISVEMKAGDATTSIIGRLVNKKAGVIALNTELTDASFFVSEIVYFKTEADAKAYIAAQTPTTAAPVTTTTAAPVTTTTAATTKATAATTKATTAAVTTAPQTADVSAAFILTAVAAAAALVIIKKKRV